MVYMCRAFTPALSRADNGATTSGHEGTTDTASTQQTLLAVLGSGEP